MGQQSITPPPRRPIIPLWLAALLLFLSASAAHSQTQATTIPLILPSAIAYDSAGNLYITETSNNVIREVDAAGTITTIAGTGTQGYSGDNGPAVAARLDSPQGLALDTNNLYIADTHNHRIRRLNLTTGILTTIAGTTAGFSGDTGPANAAQLDLPTSLAVDANHNLYIGDTHSHRIRKLNLTTHQITTIAGNGTQGFSGYSGPAIAASIDSPMGLAIDPAGDLYISDTHNHRIRKITAATGILTTIAGTGTPGYSGDSNAATAATLALPHGLSIDAAGNLYIADTENHRIRRIDAATGAMTTVAGAGTQTFFGDSGPAIVATLDSPRAVALSSTGLLTLADTSNQRIRQLDAQPAPVIHTIAGLTLASATSLTLTAPLTIVYGTGQLTANLGSPTATGSIAFTLIDLATGTATTLGTAPILASTAAFDASTLAAGSYSVLAAYAGDSTHPAVQSQPLSFRITPRALTAVPDPITLLYGQSIPTLTGAISGPLPQDDGNLNATFTAAITPLSPVAAYPISASIAGGAARNYTLTTTSANVTINPAPTLAYLTPSEISITSGTPLTLATHIASTTTGRPTGAIALMDGSTSLQSLMSSAGDATFTTSTLATGPHTLVAHYAGDKNFISSASAPILITVVPDATTAADFTLTPTGTMTQTIPSGGTANFNFTLQIQSSTLASPITLAASGLPSLATASFNPAYLPPGTSPNNFILTINTPQSTATHRNSGTSSPLLAFLLLPITSMALRLRSRSRMMTRLAIAILASALTFCSGCGSRVNTAGEFIAPAKSYTITVTGTATSPTGGILQHSTAVTLLIQSIS
jgi:sugar lactone lactonase YvrE